MSRDIPLELSVIANYHKELECKSTFEGEAWHIIVSKLIAALKDAIETENNSAIVEKLEDLLTRLDNIDGSSANQVIPNLLYFAGDDGENYPKLQELCALFHAKISLFYTEKII